MSAELDQRVRYHVYDIALREGTPPVAARVADLAGVSPAEVFASFSRLAEGRVLVLQRESGEILMANPFSAVPTPFRVRAGGVSSYGNCIWDALGIPAMLQSGGEIETSCGDCGTAMLVRIENDNAIGEGLMHFAIPARFWWKDIVFN